MQCRLSPSVNLFMASEERYNLCVNQVSLYHENHASLYHELLDRVSQTRTNHFAD